MAWNGVHSAGRMDGSGEKGGCGNEETAVRGQCPRSLASSIYLNIRCDPFLCAHVYVRESSASGNVATNASCSTSLCTVEHAGKPENKNAVSGRQIYPGPTRRSPTRCPMHSPHHPKRHTAASRAPIPSSYRPARHQQIQPCANVGPDMYATSSRTGRLPLDILRTIAELVDVAIDAVQAPAAGPGPVVLVVAVAAGTEGEVEAAVAAVVGPLEAARLGGAEGGAGVGGVGSGALGIGEVVPGEAVVAVVGGGGREVAQVAGQVVPVVALGEGEGGVDEAVVQVAPYEGRLRARQSGIREGGREGYLDALSFAFLFKVPHFGDLVRCHVVHGDGWLTPM